MRELENGAETKRRYDTWMLNLRFVLIGLVCIASGIEPLIPQFEALNALYTWIFLFHMPLFAFVTGYFARENLRGRRGNRVLLTIFIQYAIFQTLYSAADFLYFQTPGTRHSFFVPYLMLWFLAAHIGWRVMMRVMNALRIRHPIALAVLLGAAAGYIGTDGSWLSLSRLFVFLPFFAAGYAIHPQKLAALYRSGFRPVLGGLSICLLAAMFLVYKDQTPAWLYGKFTYAEMGVGGLTAALTRAAYYLLQAAAGAAFLALIPRKATRLTDWGASTLYVFLLHGIFIRSAIRMGLYDGAQTWGGGLAVIGLAVLMTVLLCQPAVRSATHWLVEPDAGLLERLAGRMHGLIRSARKKAPLLIKHR